MTTSPLDAAFPTSQDLSQVRSPIGPGTIGHLGPQGTYAEAAALICAAWLQQTTLQQTTPITYHLQPYASIPLTIQAVAQGEVPQAIVPIENSVEGGVTMTLDSLWQLAQLHIHLALVLPIQHALITRATDLRQIQRVYSHPQALSQCLQWLTRYLPDVEIIPTNSTTEGLQYLEDSHYATISSERSAQLHHLPIFQRAINDHPDNCTRFILLSREPSPGGAYTSLAFSLQANQPGGLIQVLRTFADRAINLSRIESRPSKRSMGDYLFFIDMEADARDPLAQAALQDLAAHTETLKIFGSYDLLPDAFVRSHLAL
jgi:prephenate dehydratase